MTIDAEQLKRDLATIIDPTFAHLLVTQYREMQQRYFAGDWGPAELNGGKFCEAVARAIYQLDTGIVDQALGVGDITSLLVSRTRPHKLAQKDREHFCKVLSATYKFRNDRGVAHVSPTYNANHIDATLIVVEVKWLFSEFLLLGWNRDKTVVAGIVEDIIELEHPLIHELDGKRLILSTLLSAPEEVLVHLHQAPSKRLTREQLYSFILTKTPRTKTSTINMAIKRLFDGRQVRISDSGDIVITPLGEQRAREVINSKLKAATK